MSRIAKKPIPVPKGVEVAINGAVLSIKGAKGRMELAVHEDVEVVNEDNVLKVTPRTQAQRAMAHAGTMRALANTTGWEKPSVRFNTLPCACAR